MLSMRAFIKNLTRLGGFQFICSKHTANSHRPAFIHSQKVQFQKLKLYSNDKKIRSVATSRTEDIVTIVTENGSLQFPSVWLRDNCQCNDCFHRDSQSRTIDWSRFDFDVKPLNVAVGGSNITIEWSDNHKSSFMLPWLLDRSFTNGKEQSSTEKFYRLERKTWNAKEFDQCLKKFDYQEVLSKDEALLHWLETLTIYGVALVENTPAHRESCKKLAKRVAFVRKTHYGEEFIVTAKDGTTNVAYLSAPLQLHTDLPYYHYKPGTNLLHCLVQAKGEGGENQLTDCLHVANYLKQNDPEAYKILTTTSVDWNDIGQENGNNFHSIHRAPVLCENNFGDLERVNYSQPQRDSHFHVPVELAVKWYKAVGLFSKLLQSADNTVFFKLNEGEILAFDNLRLVHGRTGYNDYVGKERYIIGCYLDWDEIYSKMRVLRKGR